MSCRHLCAGLGCAIFCDFLLVLTQIDCFYQELTDEFDVHTKFVVPNDILDAAVTVVTWGYYQLGARFG